MSAETISVVKPLTKTPVFAGFSCVILLINISSGVLYVLPIYSLYASTASDAGIANVHTNVCPFKLCGKLSIYRCIAERSNSVLSVLRIKNFYVFSNNPLSLPIKEINSSLEICIFLSAICGATVSFK